MEPIRILCVFSWLDRGGAEMMCMNLYRHIDREKIQFDFVKHSPNRGQLEDEIESLGGRVFEAPTYKGYNHFVYCNWWKQHFEAHPEHQIIHGHYYTISAIYFKMAKDFNRITIAHSHGTRYQNTGIRMMMSQFWQSKIVNYADYRLACGEKAGKWLYGDRQFTVLPNAIELKEYEYNDMVRSEIRKELDLDGKLVIGTVGRQVDPKNPMGAVELVYEMSKLTNDYCFVWVGADYWREKMEKKLKEYGLLDKMKMIGVRDDVSRVLQGLDVFVLPSIHEGLPVVAIEAQASGLPCIISDSVTEEVALTDLCTFLPISDMGKWANEIVGKKFGSRTGYTSALAVQRYGIDESAKWLSDFYLEIQKNSVM